MEDKYKLLKPILSRFCEIYVPLPIINGISTNMHKHRLNADVGILSDVGEKLRWLHKQILTLIGDPSYESIISLVDKLYQKGYSGLLLMNYVENYTCKNIDNRYDVLMCIYRIKREFRNEKFTMFFKWSSFFKMLSYLNF